MKSLPAPFLQQLRLKDKTPLLRSGYPFNLPWMQEGSFPIKFSKPVTIIVGENGSGKSTLVEAIAEICGFDPSGGGSGYRPMDHSKAIDAGGEGLADSIVAGWLPKVTTGWFFKAETFFSVARYLDQAALDVGALPPDFLSRSHGEGFAKFFEERMKRKGLYLLDEPESALSPLRQLSLLRTLHDINSGAFAQVIVATHSPIIMSLPDAQILDLSESGVREIDYRDSANYRLYSAFFADPEKFLARVFD